MSAPPLTLMASLRYDVVARLLDRVGETPSILEIGAGQGAVGARLARRGRSLGLEPDERSHAVGARRLAEAGSGEFRCAGIGSVPDGDTFDLICAFEVLEHIEDDAAALRGWVRHLRPGGHLLLSVPAHQHRYGPMDRLVGHYRRYDPEHLDRVLREAGLDVVARRLYGVPLGYVLEAARNRIARRRAAAASRTDVGTSGSGRLFQPPAAAGAAVRLAAAPFRYAQRLFPGRGTGIVALGRRPPYPVRAPQPWTPEETPDTWLRRH